MIKSDHDYNPANIILNNIGDGIFVIDDNHHVSLINPAISTIIELNTQDIVNQNWSQVLKFTDQHGQPLNNQLNPVNQALKYKRVIRQINAYILSESLKKIPIHLIVTPILDNDNKVTQIIGVMREMSLEKEAELAKTDFVSTASHEMRTPLASLEGYLSLLLDKNLDEESSEYVQQAHQIVIYLGQLFKDLLTTSQSEDGHLQHEPIVFNLVNLMNTIIDNHQKQARLKQINLKLIKIETVSDLIEADPKRIEELLNNIIENALKYTHSQGTIEVTITSIDAFLQIQIKDNGLGISDKDKPHIFQKFYRIDNSQPGSGLGLFICKKIVELYNGDIWLESQSEKGTTFYINLPRYIDK